MENPILAQADGPVRTLVLNRPEKRNALNTALTQALVDALAEADAAPDVGALILTGAGQGFCAGADTAEFAELTPDHADRVEARAALTARLHAMIPAMRLPVVAAVDGAAMGGGAGLALACDYVIASDRAVFAFPEIRHGIVAAIVMAALVKHVGRKRSFDLVATGRRMGAAEALDLGMVTEVVPEADLRARAAAVATLLSGWNRQAMTATKALVHQVADLPLAEGIGQGRIVNARMRGFRNGAPT